VLAARAASRCFTPRLTGLARRTSIREDGGTHGLSPPELKFTVRVTNRSVNNENTIDQTLVTGRQWAHPIQRIDPKMRSKHDREHSRFSQTEFSDRTDSKF